MRTETRLSFVRSLWSPGKYRTCRVRIPALAYLLHELISSSGYFRVDNAIQIYLLTLETAEDGHVDSTTRQITKGEGEFGAKRGETDNITFTFRSAIQRVQTQLPVTLFSLFVDVSVSTSVLR